MIVTLMGCCISALKIAVGKACQVAVLTLAHAASHDRRMTVLNINLSENGVYIVADTLVTGDRGRPAFFTSKVHPLPHMDGLACGTGNLAFLIDWSRDLLGGMLALDIPHLDEFVPDRLRALFAKLPDDAQRERSTVFHLGYDSQLGRFVGFAYRSADNFVSEPMQYGTLIKPGHDHKAPLIGFPDDFVALCRAQRIEQDKLAIDERTHIGGQIIAYMMQLTEASDGRAVVKTTISPAYEFEDYERAYWLCVEDLPHSN